MSIKLLLFTTLSCCGWGAMAQTVIREGELQYTETRRSINKVGRPVVIVSPKTIYFSPQALRLRWMIRGTLEYNTLARCGSQNVQNYITNGQDFYRFKEDAAIGLLDMGAYTNDQATFTYLEQDSIISGYSCKKAIMNALADGQPEPVEIWYHPGLRIDAGCFPYFYKALAGLPVLVKYNDRPQFSIGDQNEATKEFRLTGLKESEGAKMDTLLQQEKYVYIGNEKEKMNLMASMMVGKANKPGSQGTAMTETLVDQNGSSVTKTKYNPFITGTKLSYFGGRSLEGAKLSSADFQNKILVINCWFTGCIPCIKEMPLLNEVVNELSGEPVAFLSITFNTQKEVSAFLEKHPFNYQKMVDARKLIDEFGVTTYPATLIADKKGIIRLVKIGPFAEKKELTEAIRQVQAAY